jgi:CubicO group peptidase (beta-lactamase class C family)
MYDFLRCLIRLNSNARHTNLLSLAAVTALLALPCAARAADPAVKAPPAKPPAATAPAAKPLPSNATPANFPLPSATPQSQDVLPDRLAKLKGAMQKFVDEGRHAGAGYVIARNGRIVEWQTTGVRDLASGKKFERDTICRIYSMSKIVTSVAVLCLVEDGVLKLDDRLDTWLPQFKDPQVMIGGTADEPKLEPAKRPITIKHLLTHTGGHIYDFFGAEGLPLLYQRADLWESPSLDEFVNRAAKLPLKSHPGEEFNYSIADDILGAVIERASGQSFEAFLAARIFGPLGMQDTSFDVPTEKRERLATLSKRGADGKLETTEPIIGAYAEPGRGFASGGGGLFSTVGDYLRFCQMLANQGELDGRRVIGRKLIELMTVNHLVTLAKPSHQFGDANGWGLGVEVQLDLGRSSLPGSPGAFGWYGAATTYCRIDPREKTVAVLFTQHVPFNEQKVFEVFTTMYYAALK